MKLKAVLDTLDGIDEAVKQFYTERDGKFYLSVEGFDPNELETMRTAMRRAKDEKAEAIRELKDLKDKYTGLPDDFTVDEFNRLKDGGAGNIDQRLADQRARLTTDKDNAVRTEKARGDKFESMISKMAVENEINKGMAEANITLPAHQKLVRSYFVGQAKVEFEGDMPVVTIDSQSAGEKIKAYAASDEGKYVVTAPNNGGGGSGGNGGSGTKDYTKMSSTELALAQDKDPAAKAEIDRRTKIDKPERR